MQVFAGPCVIEDRDHAILVASELAKIAERLDLEITYKSSFDKANRSSALSARGPGLEEGLAILAEVKAETGLRVLTDIHETDQAAAAAEIVDILQIPAFLCRQTDLLQAAVRTGRPVLVKKGQFLSAHDMGNIVGKAHSAMEGAELPLDRLLLCERGTSFGYNELIVDMRSLEVMRRFGHPVIFDATHAVQRPGALGQASGGDREMVPVLARAAAAAGIDGLFIETHPDPRNAKSDAATVWPLDRLEHLLRDITAIDRLLRSQAASMPEILAAAE